MYFVQTKSPLMSVKGKLAMTADEVLSFIEQARHAGLEVDVTDEDGRVVSGEQLQREVGSRTSR